MKASKFSDAQKAFILKEDADGIPVAKICRKAGISSATYFNWKKNYAGLLCVSPSPDPEVAHGRVLAQDGEAHAPAGVYLSRL